MSKLSVNQIKPYAKAVAAAASTGAAYLIGVIGADGSIGDLSTSQWLGLVIALGASAGIVHKTPQV